MVAEAPETARTPKQRSKPELVRSVVLVVVRNCHTPRCDCFLTR
jgi:hypothetical protein